MPEEQLASPKEIPVPAAGVKAQNVEVARLGGMVLAVKSDAPISIQCPKQHCNKLLPYCCYGGLASVLLVYYTQVTQETDSADFVLRRFLIGAFLFPSTRMIVKWTYYLLLRSHAKSFIVSGVGGAICGLILGSRGDTPNRILSSVGFAVGAVLTEFLL